MVIGVDGINNTKQDSRVINLVETRDNNDYESCKKDRGELVLTSVKKRMVSDAPVDYWFSNELKDELCQLIGKGFVESQGIFEYVFVNGLLQDQLSRKNNYKELLWDLFVFQKWSCKNLGVIQ